MKCQKSCLVEYVAFILFLIFSTYFNLYTLLIFFKKTETDTVELVPSSPTTPPFVSNPHKHAQSPISVPILLTREGRWAANARISTGKSLNFIFITKKISTLKCVCFFLESKISNKPTKLSNCK